MNKPGSTVSSTPGVVALAELLHRAEEAAARDEHAHGIELALQAEALARQSQDADSLAQALRLLVTLNSREGLAEQAVAAGQAVLPRLRETGDDAARADVLCDMAMAFLDLGLNQEALDHISESVEAARASGDARLLCLAYNRVGLTKSHLGRYEEGERFLAESLAMARELQNEEEIYRALTNLGVVASDAFDAHESRGERQASREAIERARRHGEEALIVARRSGNAYREALTLSNLGRYLGVSGQEKAAFTLMDHARALAMQHGHRSLVLACDGNRAELLVRQQRYDEAIPILHGVLAGAQELYANAMVQDLHLQLYLAHKARGDLAEALTHHEAYHALTKEQLTQRNDAQSRLMMNRLELDQARFGAERSRMEAELQRVRAEQMSAEAERLQAQARELRRYVLADPLTGLGNRRQVERELPRLMSHSVRKGVPLAVVALDVDSFKQVNDGFGHAVGDAVLTALADLFRARVRGGDLIARMGGEEFLIVFDQASLEWSREACERLRQAVESHAWERIAPGLKVTVSLGLWVGDARCEMAQLLERADAALYQAKNEGRNRVVVAAF
ncbi:MAG TPA: tetratricopeptide repeat-containing diguanylate cyclase [Rhizobacter sp.]|nr:tetratricopeptide repeat-containing diguanylate cyclase [Rhizobacter sp.]